MSEPRHDEKQPDRRKVQPAGNAVRGDDAMDDEEKILAGRTDVNLPALLTKDVRGG